MTSVLRFIRNREIRAQRPRRALIPGPTYLRFHHTYSPDPTAAAGIKTIVSTRSRFCWLAFISTLRCVGLLGRMAIKLSSSASQLTEFMKKSPLRWNLANLLAANAELPITTRRACLSPIDFVAAIPRVIGPFLSRAGLNSSSVLGSGVAQLFGEVFTRSIVEALLPDSRLSLTALASGKPVI